MTTTKMEWSLYQDKLKRIGYSEEQIEEVKKIRESDKFELMTYEQFKFLCDQRVIHRTRKLKTPRNLFVCEETGRMYYLDHYHRKFNFAGYWKEEE